MSSDLLHSDNFLEYCWRHRDRRLVQDEEEFFEDLQSIKYLKKLITRYKSTLELKERLITNHIILLNNLFGPEVTAKLLYFKTGEDFKFLKPFLLRMDLLPRFLYSVGDEGVVDTAEIPSDDRVSAIVREAL